MNAVHQPQAPSSRQEERRSPEAELAHRVIKFGLIGSLAGTVAMDLVMVVESLIIGQPLDGFVALIGSVVGGDALVGVVVHLLMGSLLGFLFGIAIYQVRALNIDSVQKGVWLGVLAGLVTIPTGCVPVAIVTHVPIVEMVSFSFVPHLVWGAVLGVITGKAIHSSLSRVGVAAPL